MEAPFYDVMVDLETTGTDGSENALLQIAACCFDYTRGRIGPMFCINLEMAAKRYWDEDTRNWWAGQPRHVFERVTEHPVHPQVAMEAFRAWVLTNTGTMEGPRLWAKPSSFEWPFLQSYFKQFGVPNPFHYRDVVDLRSFTRGLMRDPNGRSLDKEVPMEGDAHHALDDVLHQIKVVFHAKFMFGENSDGNESSAGAGEPAAA